MEALATTADPKAITAMRQRHLECFTELETERAEITAELATLTGQQVRLISPELLDHLPVIPAILAELPAKLRRRLYQTFDISIVYKNDTGQAAFRATITTSTPETVAAIIHDSHNPPATPAAPVRTPNVSLSRQQSVDHELRTPARAGRVQPFCVDCRPR